MWHIEGFSVSRLHWTGDCFEVVHYVGQKVCRYIYIYLFIEHINKKNKIKVYNTFIYSHQKPSDHLPPLGCVHPPDLPGVPAAQLRGCLGLQVQIYGYLTSQDKRWVQNCKCFLARENSTISSLEPFSFILKAYAISLALHCSIIFNYRSQSPSNGWESVTGSFLPLAGVPGAAAQCQEDWSPPAQCKSPAEAARWELQAPEAEAGGLQAGQHTLALGRALELPAAHSAAFRTVLKAFQRVSCKGQIEKVFYLQRLWEVTKSWICTAPGPKHINPWRKA